MVAAQPFEEPGVRGLLFDPEALPCAALLLAHGAGANCRAPLLSEVAGTFAAAGCLALLIDLPFRQARPSGPPRAGDPERDRAGLREALKAETAGAGRAGGAGRTLLRRTAIHPARRR
jgi:predicted alpha/beta-hydrolase family hydrolase